MTPLDPTLLRSLPEILTVAPLLMASLPLRTLKCNEAVEPAFRVSGAEKMLVLAAMAPPELTVIFELLLLPWLNVVPLALSVPPTAIDAAPQQPGPIATWSPLAKLSSPLSVSV